MDSGASARTGTTPARAGTSCRADLHSGRGVPKLAVDVPDGTWDVLHAACHGTVPVAAASERDVDHQDLPPPAGVSACGRIRHRAEPLELSELGTISPAASGLSGDRLL